jgi:hypothetical protein
MIRRTLLTVCGIVAVTNLALSFTACNQDTGNKPVEAGPPPPTPDAGAPLCGGDIPVAKILDSQGNPAAPNWSCYEDTFDGGILMPVIPFADAGDADADLLDALPDVLPGDAADDAVADAAPDATVLPDAGTDGCRMRLTDFVALAPVPSTEVDLFFDNDATGAPSFTGTTGDTAAGNPAPGHAGTGEFFFPPPTTNLIAYRVKPRVGVAGQPDLRGLLQFDTVACKAGETYAENSITVQAADSLKGGVLGSTREDPKKMGIVMGVRDCDFKEVSGGTIEVIDDGTGLPIQQSAGTTDYRGAYFGSSGFPDTACTHTVATQSLYTALNVPADRSITIRARARTSDLDPSPGHILGEQKLRRFPGYFVIQRPYRLTKK